MTQEIMIIDDDLRMTQVLARRLSREGQFCVSSFDSAAAALAEPTRHVFGILLDMMLGDEIGLDYIERLNAHFRPSHLIVISGYASIPTTVKAMKLGATDYLTKPVNSSTIIQRLGNGDIPLDTESLRPMTPAQAEWEHIQRVLDEHDGNISATAKALGIHRRTLQRKLQKMSPKRDMGQH
ncbi:response regulator [Alteromonas sp. C1M14]|uniref:response regulator transcription factor n=1 Tax=Alteromonas sp. C1M14 TaxID=2841567 RepID=UPI001C07F7F3|nr:response regulator [Alteromonas sp. C1M14]MBU2977191.1 response regulator [Alteromonas sp. C1M14]